MSRVLDVLLAPRLWTLFIAPNIAFLAVALATEAFELISVLNIVVVALATNVCVAFAPNVVDAIFSKRAADKADYISIGIFSAWFSIILGACLSLVYRYLGEPRWLVDTDFTSYRNFMLACAAVFHLAAPGSIKDRVPPIRWVRIGSIVAAAVFVALVALYSSDLRNAWRGVMTPHDHGAGPAGFVVPI